MMLGVSSSQLCEYTSRIPSAPSLGRRISSLNFSVYSHGSSGRGSTASATFFSGCRNLITSSCRAVGRAVMVEGAFSQDEAVIVELEVRRVVKDHFALMRLDRFIHLAELDAERLGRVMREFPEFVKRLLVGKQIRLQQQLVLAKLNLIRRYDRFVKL